MFINAGPPVMRQDWSDLIVAMLACPFGMSPLYLTFKITLDKH
jgi:hypothetical protein